MIYRRFSFLIVVRIALIVANSLILSTIFGDKRLFFNQIILFIIFIFQIVELVRFVNHTNRELSKLFYAIRHSDFSITFKRSILGKSFKELEESMIEIIQAYKQVKIEKEAQFHLLQMLVNQLHVGIVVLDGSENITLINPTAQRLTGIEGLKNWKLLQQLNPSLAREIDSLEGHGKKLVEIKTSVETSYLSVEIGSLMILNQPMKLISMQNINSEIEQKEIEAWHKLIRILTHEIMNSVTPISSLTETMQMMLSERDGAAKDIQTLDQETITDIRFSLNTIQKRTDGLLNFVDNYRKLTRIPKPTLQQVMLADFLEGIRKLMSKEADQKKIRIEIHGNDRVAAEIDPILFEQVLINMVTNSMHALEGKEDALVELRFGQRDRSAYIEIIDNGSGISPKEITEIFIPFFTTKQNGSGIGLSLSKQILAAHGGTIKVKSIPHISTTFTLHFPLQSNS